MRRGEERQRRDERSEGEEAWRQGWLGGSRRGRPRAGSVVEARRDELGGVGGDEGGWEGGEDESSKDKLESRIALRGKCVER